MGRPSTFDREVVIDRAMKLFWKKGYEGVTLQNLLETFEINNSSFYNAFHSKEALFDEVLDYYYKKIGAYRIAPLLSSGLVSERLHEYFSRLIEMNWGEQLPNGCFIANSAILAAAATPAIAERVQKVVHATEQRLETVFRELLERGVASGEVRADLDPVPHSRLFVSVVFGLHLMARAANNRQQLEDVAAAAMQTCFPGQRFNWEHKWE